MIIEIIPTFKNHSMNNILAQLEIKTLGIEDIIIDRLNALVHWKSLEDGRLAKELVLIHFNKIDWKYLKKRAEDERVGSELTEIQAEMQKERDKYENKL